MMFRIVLVAVHIIRNRLSTISSCLGRIYPKRSLQKYEQIKILLLSDVISQTIIDENYYGACLPVAHVLLWNKNIKF